MNLNLTQYCLKIKLIIKSTPYDDDEFGGTYKLDFENALYRIDGGHMIIEVLEDGDVIGQVFELKTIKSFSEFSLEPTLESAFVPTIKSTTKTIFNDNL